VSATGLSFPPYLSFSSLPTTGTGTVSVACDEVAPPNVTVSLSAGSSGSFAARTMRGGTGGTGVLNYNVFTDSGMTSVWGDGAGGGSTVYLHRVRKNEGGRVTTLYGSIPAGQNAPVGIYGDSLTVTISW
jgi:spore coat protein U-like protein